MVFLRVVLACLLLLFFSLDFLLPVFACFSFSSDAISCPFIHNPIKMLH